MMFGKKNVENIGMEFERGLVLGAGQFSKEQVSTLRVAFELAMVNVFRIIENRAKMKETQRIKK
jgi:hypothetical protein